MQLIDDEAGKWQPWSLKIKGGSRCIGSPLSVSSPPLSLGESGDTEMMTFATVWLRVSFSAAPRTQGAWFYHHKYPLCRLQPKLVVWWNLRGPPGPGEESELCNPGLSHPSGLSSSLGRLCSLLVPEFLHFLVGSFLTLKRCTCAGCKTLSVSSWWMRLEWLS